MSFAYGEEPVVDDVSFSLAPGEFVALVGPNGSGKSTLLRLLLGLLRPDTGVVHLFGVDPHALSDRARLGYVPQRRVLAPDLPVTVREIVVDRAARPSGLVASGTPERSRRGRPRDRVGRPGRALPAGRCSSSPAGSSSASLIARALASEPELLVLDEPIAGVDAESQRLFRDSLVHLVAEHGAAVLLVSHELGAVADDLDRVLVMKRSIKFDGPPAELTATGVSLGVHDDDLPLWLEAIE